MQLLTRHLAAKDVSLPKQDITIRRGQTISVDGYGSIDLKLYKHRRNPAAQLVTPSPDHLGFGHGLHMCPGRSFASNKVKLALCHLLWNYDWKLVPGNVVGLVIVGTSANVNPTAVMMIKRREEEFKVDYLGFGELDS
ncbi:ent-kaurene oxidase [Colletotrichum orchidophilum]|uniref:Ent-kaurene oxidase n=1 Tax=Colletotrichum orchidophilum TaxID=1209926 RepID=A0A1G4B4W1_9PEZI|nr:ent-kaurene oxidase [Colletotrichum orchidophilum]OHE96312.1 ent-kaurene oxidase [Colletotrichum orchidophilum]